MYFIPNSVNYPQNNNVDSVMLSTFVLQPTTLSQYPHDTAHANTSRCAVRHHHHHPLTETPMITHTAPSARS